MEQDTRTYMEKYSMKLFKSGFTLIELLVVISIIAILAAVSAASYSTAQKKARDTKRKSDIEQIRTALEMYRADNGGYPSGAGGGVTVTIDSCSGSCVLLGLTSGNYMKTLPKDPKTGTYYYYYTTNAVAPAPSYCLYATLEAAASTSFSTGCATLGSGDNYSITNP